MNVAPFVIEDDDVMIVNDDNKNSGLKQNASTSVDTIILDEEPLPTPTNGPTVTDSDRESSFARLLKNNTLLNKIVQRCLNMENNAGMSRVINKTLLPLYSDADNKFKESEQLTKLLKENLKKLKQDPNYKFLHVKSLCEELKAGKYRRKVPFVTLSTELKRDTQKRLLSTELKRDTHKRLLSTELKRDTRKKLLQQLSEKRHNSRMRRATKKAKNICKETDVINLDNSDDEPIITLDVDDDINFANDCDGDNDDIMIVDETANSDVGSEQSNKENSNEVSENYMTSTSECFNPKDKNDVVITSSCEHLVTKSTNRRPSAYDGHDQMVPKNNNKVVSTSECNRLVTKVRSTSDDKHLMQKNDNKIARPSEFEHLRQSSAKETSICSEGLVPENNNKLSSISRCDLLVPKKAVEPAQHSHDFNRCIAIEQQIALYQEKILQLEEEEVTKNSISSPYVQCDKYKTKIVQLYKKLCKITGNGDGNLLKQRVVRLQVVEGHPSGPVMRLERFLNNTIDETGVVPLPDLHDVIRCVTQSNIVDRLNWSQQEIMREAIALFTQCCHALRKSRQRREYKDLLSLVRDQSLDDYDPANEDPHLFAKLEENKVIAKANEEEIFERFVQMEYLPKASQTLTPRLGNMSRIKDAGPTDTESDSDLDLTPPKESKTHVIPTDYNKGQDTTKRKIDDTVPINKKPTETSRSLDENKTCKAQENFALQHVIDTIVKKELTTTTNIENIPTAQTKIQRTDITTRNPDKYTKSNPSTHNETNISTQNPANSTGLNTTNYTTPNLTSTTTQNLKNTTQYITNRTTQHITQQIIQNPVNDHARNTQRHIPVSNTLQRIGSSNRYVVTFDSKDNSQQHVGCSNNKVERDYVKVTEMNANTSDNKDIKIETGDATIKQEPIDINGLLDALGDNYISTIFDIEDPFLVVDISSDSSDDEL